MAGGVWSTPNAVTTIFTAANLQGLSAGTGITSSAIDNSSTADIFADVIFAVMWQTAPTAGERALELYLLPSPDGTNYATVASNYPQQSLMVARLESVKPSTTVLEYLNTAIITIPPGSFKWHVVNRSIRNVHTSNSTMFAKMRPIQMTV